MDPTWIDRLDLFRYALAAALAAGVVCPLVGTFLFVRRTSFYGIALPQFATAGMVFGFVLLPWWIARIGLGGLEVDEALSDSHTAMNYHLAWSLVFTFGGLAALVAFARRGGGEIGHIAAAFAIANAATILFGRLSPIGKSFVDELLQGEILTVGPHELELLLALLCAVLLLIVLFHRDLLIVSFDPETARVLGKRVLALQLLFAVITGVTVSVGTMTLGPTLLFGLIVLPPLAARAYARSMASLFVLAASIGVAAVAMGVVASFELDLPLGAAIVAAAALLLVPGAWKRRRERA